MERLQLHPGVSYPESLRGQSSAHFFRAELQKVLPSVLPAASAQRRWGFTDLSRFTARDRSRAGQFLTRQGISLTLLLRSLLWSGGWSFLPASACRHAGRTVSSTYQTDSSGVAWRTVSEDPTSPTTEGFPAGCPHSEHFYCHEVASSQRYSEIPAYSQVSLRQRVHLRTVIVTAAVYRGFDS